MRRLLAAAVVMASLTATGVAISTGVAHADPPSIAFPVSTDFSVGTQRPTSVADGDLNGDGHLDVVVANDNGTVSVLLNDGAGNFPTHKDLGTSGGTSQSVAVADLNGDGHLDIAFTSATAFAVTNTVDVLLGDGTGNFGPENSFATGQQPFSVAVGDLNGDSHPDLAVANANSGTASVLLGDGAGSFGPKTDFTTGGSATAVAIGDVNADSHLDLVVSDQHSNTVAVLLGNGAGVFTVEANVVTEFAPSDVAIRDLNEDGHLDIAATSSVVNAIAVMLGDGTGNFGPKTDFATGSTPFEGSLAVGDLNGDGHLDLAAAARNTAKVSVLLGDGAGSFAPRADFATGSQPRAVAIGDLNGDSRPDLAVANEASNSISVLLNGQVAPQAPTIGAVQAGNGQVTVSWSAPALDGGSPITAYVVTGFVGFKPQPPVVFNSTATTQTITGLTNGTTYRFSVQAVNAIGPGARSNVSKPAVPGAAGPPAIGAALAGEARATVSWTAPADPGGSPITGYVVTAYVGFSPLLPVSFDSTDTTQVITGLTNGTTYRFRVQAVNASGRGAYSKVTNAATPPTPPTVPSIPFVLGVTAGDAQVTVSWEDPQFDGGVPVTGYVVTPFIGFMPQSPVTFDSTSLTQTVSGLTNGTTYRFSVEAVNAVGTGPVSPTSKAVTPGTAGPPLIGAAVAGDSAATVSWSAPANPGSSPITGYVVTPYVDYTPRPSATFDSTATTQVVAGLTNGTTYRFRVQAINASGAGAFSTVTNAVTPNP
jgi:hypothetical protein